MQLFYIYIFIYNFMFYIKDICGYRYMYNIRNQKANKTLKYKVEEVLLEVKQII